MRKTKEDRPVVAICYDFDKTLSPDDMQAQGYIQSVGYEVDKFWEKSDVLAKENGMDSNLAYMYLMMEEAKGNLVFNRKALEEYGSKVKLFPGADTWFERIRQYGEEHGVIVEHYIISSGLKEMIEGTSVAKAGAFEQIYASSFLYDDRGLAIWPAQVVNYTNKTQFLFRISKGVLDWNDPGVNDYFPQDEIRVPFRNLRRLFHRRLQRGDERPDQGPQDDAGQPDQILRVRRLPRRLGDGPARQGHSPPDRGQRETGVDLLSKPEGEQSERLLTLIKQ